MGKTQYLFLPLPACSKKRAVLSSSRESNSSFTIFYRSMRAIHALFWSRRTARVLVLPVSMAPLASHCEKKKLVPRDFVPKHLTSATLFRKPPPPSFVKKRHPATSKASPFQYLFCSRTRTSHALPSSLLRVLDNIKTISFVPTNP